MASCPGGEDFKLKRFFCFVLNSSLFLGSFVLLWLKYPRGFCIFLDFNVTWTLQKVTLVGQLNEGMTVVHWAFFVGNSHLDCI